MASNRVGEIVFLDFPYTNFKNSKIRPAVILGQSDIDKNDYIVAYITSEVDNYIWSEFAVSLKACDLSTQTLILQMQGKRGLSGPEVMLNDRDRIFT